MQTEEQGDSTISPPRRSRGARSRRGALFAVVSLLLAACSFLFWVHGEVISLGLVETTRLYLKNVSAVAGHKQVHRHPQLQPSSLRQSRREHDNETDAGVDIVSPMMPGGKNASLAFHSTNETPMSAAALVLNNASFETTTTNATLGGTEMLIPTVSTNHTATIVVYLSGEMGNHLSILAKALVVQLVAQQEYVIDAKLVLHHQRHSKWVRGRDSLQQCFPHLRTYDFDSINTDAFERLSKEQEEWLASHKWDPARMKLMGENDEQSRIHDALSYWKEIMESSSSFRPALNNTSVPVSLPFLSVKLWCPLDMIDQYLLQIRSFLRFDKPACCNIMSDPDETVFHLRNFLVEMPRRGKRKGFEELSPNKTAFELFSHLNSSDKVAITTRFGGDDVEPYVSELQGRGLTVRVIEGQSGTEDFCFLMTAQKELIGTFRSTYVTWAAYLGDTKRVILYHVISPNTNRHSYQPFNWSHPYLKDRVYSEAHKSEEQEAFEAHEEVGRMLLYQEWAGF